MENRLDLRRVNLQQLREEGYNKLVDEFLIQRNLQSRYPQEDRQLNLGSVLWAGTTQGSEFWRNVSNGLFGNAARDYPQHAHLLENNLLGLENEVYKVESAGLFK
jgi:hypothetical protein